MSLKSFLFPGNSRSSIICFFRSFLMLKTCWQYIHLENLTITVSAVLPTRETQASVLSEEILQPSFLKSFKIVSSRASPETSRGMFMISRHSRLEYWSFAQQCLSKIVNLVNNKLLAYFVTGSSAYSFETDSLSLRTYCRTILVLSSNLLCRDRTIGMRSCLLSLSSESLVYHAIFHLLKSY